MKKETEQIKEAKIRSLESQLVKLKEAQVLMFNVLAIGINRMEESLKESIKELKENTQSD